MKNLKKPIPSWIMKELSEKTDGNIVYQLDERTIKTFNISKKEVVDYVMYELNSECDTLEDILLLMTKRNYESEPCDILDDVFVSGIILNRNKRIIQNYLD